MNLSITNYQEKPEEVKRPTLRLYEWAVQNKLKSVRFVIADQFYYSKTLEQRRDILGAPSINYLCKTIVFQNTAYDPKFQGPYYPKYVAVMVQYVAKINTQKLNRQVRLFQQKNDSQNKASKQYFHYRLADQKISQQLTGYQHNAVTPIMFNYNMPIIFSHEIQKLSPQFFWMGGGHPWTKMRVSLQQFKKTYPNHVLISDVTYQKGNQNLKIED